MSSTIDDDFDAADAYAFTGVPIQPVDTGQPRFPFLFLIDVSASTAAIPDGSDRADILSLNDMLRNLFARLNSGPPGDPLELKRPEIDVAVITYADQARVHMPWTRADTINPSPPPIDALPEATRMGEALSYAITYVRDMQQYYRRQKLPKSGLPVIFHITDGGATDLDVGKEKAQELRNAIDHLNPGGEVPSKLLIYHFITPNGYLASITDTQNNRMTGEQYLIQLFGKNHVMPLRDGVDSFDTLVRFITVTISSISQGPTPTAEMLKNLMSTFNVMQTAP